MLTKIICTCLLFEIVLSDFYIGMYDDKDYLVSREFVFKQATPGKKVSIEYGRLYKCPITYILVKDRVGLNGGPKVVITKGGLRAKFFAMNIISPPGLPVSVIVTVACINPHGAAEKEGIDEDYNIDYIANGEKDGNDTKNLNETTTATHDASDKSEGGAEGEDDGNNGESHTNEGDTDNKEKGSEEHAEGSNEDAAKKNNEETPNTDPSDPPADAKESPGEDANEPPAEEATEPPAKK